MVQRSFAGEKVASGVLAEQEQQIVIEVLHLYRDGGSLTSIEAKLHELRAVRERLQELCPHLVAPQGPISDRRTRISNSPPV